MFNLERLLASKYFAKKYINKIIEPNIVFNEEKMKFYLIFKLESKNKNGQLNTRLYKNDISILVNKHGGLKNLFLSLVAADMSLKGYLIIPIEGGWLCVGGEETYALKEQECSCRAFINNNKKPCKHLLYRDALAIQRSRINNWKINNL